MKSILIIEDQQALAQLYQKAFENAGYEIVVAADGDEGLATAQQVRPTLILLDLVLPRLNGLAVLKELKSDDATRDIPVIILTNLDTASDRQTADDLGAADYIVKAYYTPKKVVALVRNFLETRSNPE